MKMKRRENAMRFSPLFQIRRGEGIKEEQSAFLLSLFPPPFLNRKTERKEGRKRAKTKGSREKRKKEAILVLLLFQPLSHFQKKEDREKKKAKI